MACYRSKYPGSYIFSSSRSVSVAWGQFSIVQAELHCLKDLLDNGRNWSYALDMAGSEVVLLTNREQGSIFFQEILIMLSRGF